MKSLRSAQMYIIDSFIIYLLSNITGTKDTSVYFCLEQVI